MTSIERALGTLRRRVENMVARGVLRIVASGTGIQGVQMEVGALGEVRGPMEHFQPYGFTSNPKPGAEGVVVFVGGSRDHGLTIVVDDRRYRLKTLASGEVALYTDEPGNVIHFKHGGIVQVKASATVQVEAPNVEISAAASVSVEAPEITVSGGVSVTMEGGGSSIEVAAAGVTITAPLVAASGILQGATVQQGPGTYVLGTVAEDTKAIYNSHTHNENGDGGGTTDPPNEPIP